MNLPLIKIISGGQTGADQAGLQAGRDLNLETGGTAPYNWMTDEGVNRSLKEYGLEPCVYDPKTYPKRTLANVTNSDGTVVFGNTNSPGCRLTIKYCKLLRKPYNENPSIIEFRLWLKHNNIKILNVAGNRERINKGIFSITYHFLMEALRES